METADTVQPRGGAELSSGNGGNSTSTDGSSPDQPCRTFNVRFGRTSSLGRSQADSFGFIGKGSIEIDGPWVRVYGRRRRSFRFGEKDQHAFKRLGVFNVGRSGKIIRFDAPSEDESPRYVWFRARTEADAREIQSLLPSAQSAQFAQEQSELLEFHERLNRFSPIAPVTPVLMAANIAVFIAMCMGGVSFFKPDGASVVGWGSNYGPLTMGGEWWRLFTAMFIHFGIVHIAFNMWALLQIGRTAERLFGSTRFFLLYILSGLVGSMASLLWNPLVNSAGASGAIFGILGGLLAFVINPRNDVPKSVMAEHRNGTLIFAAYSLFYGFAHTGIDNAAHLGGLLSGFALGVLLARPLNEKARTADGSVRLLTSISAGVAMLGLLGWPLVHPSARVAGDQRFQLVLAAFDNQESQAVDAANQLATKVRWQGVSKADYMRMMYDDVLPKWDALYGEVAGAGVTEDSGRYPLQQALLRYLESRRKQFRFSARAVRFDDAELEKQAKLEQQNGDAALADIKKLSQPK